MRRGDWGEKPMLAKKKKKIGRQGRGAVPKKVTHSIRKTSERQQAKKKCKRQGAPPQSKWNGGSDARNQESKKGCGQTQPP